MATTESTEVDSPVDQAGDSLSKGCGTDVGAGLAYSYYYGYLKLVLPGMRERARQKDSKTFPKMVIMLPESCFCPSTLEEDSAEYFRHVGFIPFQANRAGNVKRDYKSSVYEVSNPDNTEEKFQVIVELATPLMSLYEMQDDRLAGLSKSRRAEERKKFIQTLRYILGHAKASNCHDAFTLLEYSDPRDKNRKPDFNVARVLCQHIKLQLPKEEPQLPYKLPDYEYYHVFISHSHKNDKIALRIHDYLVTKKYLCYLYNTCADIGRSVFDNCVGAIQRSHKTLLLLSHDTIASNYCTWEIKEAIYKENQEGRVCLVPVLLNINIDELPGWHGTLKERKALTYSDDNKFWKMLEETLRTDNKLSDRLYPGDVGYGLAWSFYYGYLKLKLPKLDCTDDWLENQIHGNDKEKACYANSIKYGKMVILVPESGFCPSDLKEVGGFKNICCVPFKAARAGNPERDYKSSIFEITNENQSEKYVMVIEYATPVMSMYEMHNGITAIFDQRDLDIQRKTFEVELVQILEKDPDCRGKVLQIAYKDTPKMNSKDNFELASLVIEYVKADINAGLTRP